MDYPFFTGQLGKIPLEYIEELKQVLSGQTYVHHEAFGYHQKVERGTAEIPRSLIDKMIDSFGIGLMKKEDYIGYKIDMLRARGKILIHSDMNGTNYSNIYGVGHKHNVHIPVITNPGVRVFHQRSLASPPSAIKSRHLEVGTAYLFNDYVHHWVDNDGDEDRIHVLFYFQDPKWETKVDIYKQFKIDPAKYYEIV